MNFPTTRHYQRYEYLIESKKITPEKRVLEVGCGELNFIGIYAGLCKSVVAIDPKLKDLFEGNYPPICLWNTPKKEVVASLFPIYLNQLEKSNNFDIAIAVEVVEHVKEIDGFLKDMSGFAPYSFITTPLAEVTGPTRNPNHVVEYSHKDLVDLVSKYFEVEDTVYQQSDLRIESSGKFTGDSMDPAHTVQMLWLRSKNYVG
jgi:hypothetical protein